MKKYKILGITKVSYVKDGKQVEGITLHLGTERPDTDGCAVQQLYISKKNADCYKNASACVLGDEVHLMYEMSDYGKPVLMYVEVE